MCASSSQIKWTFFSAHPFDSHGMFLAAAGRAQNMAGSFVDRTHTQKMVSVFGVIIEICCHLSDANKTEQKYNRTKETGSNRGQMPRWWPTWARPSVNLSVVLRVVFVCVVDVFIAKSTNHYTMIFTATEFLKSQAAPSHHPSAASKIAQKPFYQRRNNGWLRRGLFAQLPRIWLMDSRSCCERGVEKTKPNSIYHSHLHLMSRMRIIWKHSIFYAKASPIKRKCFSGALTL